MFVDDGQYTALWQALQGFMSYRDNFANIFLTAILEF